MHCQWSFWKLFLYSIDGIIGLIIGVILLLICQNIVSEETIIKLFYSNDLMFVSFGAMYVRD